MDLSDTLEELLRVCWQKNISFELKNDEFGTNCAEYSDTITPTVKILYNGKEDKALLEKINLLIDELK